MSEAAAYVELAALPVTPFWARRLTAAVLGAWQIATETVDTAELLVSELVTNAIKMAGPGPGQLAGSWPDDAERIRLTLRLLPGRIVIEVFDNDPNPPILADADTYAENGRGLLLVDALSKEWSYFFPPSGGKVVYCVISTESQPMHLPGCPRTPTEARYDHAPAAQPQTAHPPAGPGDSLAD